MTEKIEHMFLLQVLLNNFFFERKGFFQYVLQNSHTQFHLIIWVSKDINGLALKELIGDNMFSSRVR